MAGDLTYRSRRILYAVVTEYVATGEPVGSRRLSKRYGIHLSPATIRNVLADLEEAGYLRQPHTSAGRVPTELGFRLFVDALVQMREVSQSDRTAILARMGELGPSDDVLGEAGKLLSALTGAASVVTLPRPAEERLAQLHFMNVRKGQMLAVVITNAGQVQNRVLAVQEEIVGAELDRLNNYLRERVQGRTLQEVRDLVVADRNAARGEYLRLQDVACSVLDATLPAADIRGEVRIEGQGTLFDRPEFVDVEKVRQYMRAFEEKERLLDLLEQTLAAQGVRVVIGAEARLDEVQDISVISSSYRTPGQGQGTLGIIGPVRMDYAKVVPLVGFTARVISRWMDEEEPVEGSEAD